jgi:hypothetical protein
MMMLRAAALLVALGAAACARKAPGPAECQTFAEQVVGAARPGALAIPHVKDAVDELTVRCLTTPFSRRLLRCVEEGGPVRYCFLAHGARPAAPSTRPAPFSDTEF